MLRADDLQNQLRSELAVVESTIVSIPDLTLALGEGTSAAAMERWLCQSVPKGTTIEYHPLRQCFALRRGPKAKPRARSHRADPSRICPS